MQCYSKTYPSLWINGSSCRVDVNVKLVRIFFMTGNDMEEKMSAIIQTLLVITIYISIVVMLR